jgi:hypothetical protein
VLADTANLVVALKLDDKFSGPLGRVNRQLGDFNRNASVRGGIGQIGAGIGQGLKTAAIVGLPAIALITTQVKAGVDSLRELESVSAQTDAVLESTGGSAGITAKQIRDLSEEYETLGGVIDDKVIQSGANVLLTFTNIREKAFEPALEAALDLSTAMDQDLQSSIVQIGKALNDPVRGVTALRRVGVQLSKEQESQIKDLVKAGDTLAAQQIILAELNKEFGGSFEAAGQTGEATIARLGDSIEGLQQNLATAFLPAIDKVARRLTDIFGDPEVQRGVAEFGENIAGFLTDENFDKAEQAVRDVFGYLGTVPWGAIGSGLRIAGEAAKVAVGAFNALPPGVQQGLITLLAAQKLGAFSIASGVGQLLSVALTGLKTNTAGHVTVVGGTVTGGPGGVGGGVGGSIAKGLKVGAALSAIPLAGVAAAEVINFQDMRDKATGFLEGKLDDLDRATADQTQASIDKIQAQIDMERPFLDGILFNTNVKPVLERELSELREVKRSQYRVADRTASLEGLARSAQSYYSRIASAGERTAAKDFSFDPKITSNVDVTVPITNIVNSSVIQTQLHRLRTTVGGGGFI